MLCHWRSLDLPPIARQVRVMGENCLNFFVVLQIQVWQMVWRVFVFQCCRSHHELNNMLLVVLLLPVIIMMMMMMMSSSSSNMHLGMYSYIAVIHPFHNGQEISVNVECDWVFGWFRGIDINSFFFCLQIIFLWRHFPSHSNCSTSERTRCSTLAPSTEYSHCLSLRKCSNNMIYEVHKKPTYQY